MQKIDLYTIPGYMGECSLDPKEVTEYLLSIDVDSNRRNSDSDSIMHQDIVIKQPFNDIISTLTAEILLHASHAMDTAFELLDPVWFIAHSQYEQTYPHSHNYGPFDWAVVYWANVPVDSGVFQYYPVGMPGVEMKIQPQEGKFLIFPGTLLHGVRENGNKTEKRVSLSCNIKALQ